VSRFPAWPGSDKAYRKKVAQTAEGQEQDDETELDIDAAAAFTADRHQGIRGAINWYDVDEQLRGALTRMAQTAEKMDPLPEGCTFTIAVELREEGHAPIGVSFFFCVLLLVIFTTTLCLTLDRHLPSNRSPASLHTDNLASGICMNAQQITDFLAHRTPRLGSRPSPVSRLHPGRAFQKEQSLLFGLSEQDPCFLSAGSRRQRRSKLAFL